MVKPKTIEFYKAINNIGFIHNFEASWKTKAGEERFGLISAEIFELSGKTIWFMFGMILQNDKSRPMSLNKNLMK